MKIIQSVGNENEYYVGYNGDDDPSLVLLKEKLIEMDNALIGLNFHLNFSRPIYLRRMSQHEDDVKAASDLMADYEHTAKVTIFVS